jgi:hypothetical protein
LSCLSSSSGLASAPAALRPTNKKDFKCMLVYYFPMNVGSVSTGVASVEKIVEICSQKEWSRSRSRTSVEGRKVCVRNGRGEGVMGNLGLLKQIGLRHRVIIPRLFTRCAGMGANCQPRLFKLRSKTGKHNEQAKADVIIPGSVVSLLTFPNAAVPRLVSPLSALQPQSNGPLLFEDSQTLQ